MGTLSASAQFLKKLAVITTGPGDLDILSFFNFSQTTLLGKSMLQREKVLLEPVIMGNTLEGSFVKTLENVSAKKWATSSLQRPNRSQQLRTNMFAKLL